MFEKFCFWCNEEFAIDPAKGLVEICPKCASAPPIQPSVFCPTCSRSLKLPKNAAERVGQKFRCSGYSVEGESARAGAAPIPNISKTAVRVILKCGQLCRLATDPNSDTGFVLEAMDQPPVPALKIPCPVCRRYVYVDHNAQVGDRIHCSFGCSEPLILRKDLGQRYGLFLDVE